MSVLSLALVGNPNCGKTSLFNQLTGKTQRVGNWPGVTVECQSGDFSYRDNTVHLIDLPGIYSLDSVNENTDASHDEQIACQYLLTQHFDILINVLDASHLERHLYLTVQLLAMKLPLIVVLNKMDLARKRGVDCDIEQLARSLNCPVIPVVARSGDGLEALREQIVQSHCNPLHAATLSAKCVVTDDMDPSLAEARYHFVDQVIKQVVRPVASAAPTISAAIDRIVLNRMLAVPIFFAVMYVLFWLASGVGQTLQNFFDIISRALFIDGLKHVLGYWHSPEWLIGLLANGVGGGMNTLATFIPVLSIMFLFLCFLEDSGYMARSAFIMDRITRTIGLPGKAFIPMILGFACNVPAVMAARTLGSRREQILTVMMTPFMSCSARLAIYAVFAAAFFPKFAASAIFCLYLLGIVVALFTAFLLRKTLLNGHTVPFVMELPNYHWPRATSVLYQTWQRLWGFLWRAGKLILPVCVLIGVLNSVSVEGKLTFAPTSPNSIASTVGRSLTPLFAPLGIHQDNWPATVGLLTGVLAKEVVVGSLNTLYKTEPMTQRFDGAIGAFAYLIFVLLYCPCVSTIAIIARELGKKWACFAVAWSTLIAYGLAVSFYQIATLRAHPLSSMLYIAATLTSITVVLCVIHWVGRIKSSGHWVVKERKQHFAGGSACGKCRQCS